MLVVKVGHQPGLTLEDAKKVFQRHLASKYKIYKGKWPGAGWPGRGFVVKESAWRAVLVSLGQKRNETVFYLGGVAGSGIVGIFWVLLGTILLATVLGFLGAALMTGGIGGAIGALIALLLGLWLLSFVSGIPGHRLIKEIKAFMESAEEFTKDLQKIKSSN